MRPSPSSILLAGALCVFFGQASAQTVQTFGSGSAVGTADRAASFDPLAVNGVPLSDYAEDALLVAVDGDSWVGEGTPVFDPFHGANGSDRAFYFPYGGSPGWVTIQTTDGRPIYGLEFLYGNGWTTGDVYGQYPWGNDQAVVEWQTRDGALLVSAGTIGGGPLLEMGTVVGFHDTKGFDRLLVRCRIATSYDTTLQALALDGLRVALSDNVTAADAPRVPATFALHPVAPNPVREGALVAFDLPREGPVRLAVHDLAGRLVRSLVAGVRPAGPGTVRWDGLDAAGRRVPSGVYVVRLTADGRTVRRSVVVAH